jgi:hypothetical protein
MKDGVSDDAHLKLLWLLHTTVCLYFLARYSRNDPFIDDVMTFLATSDIQKIVPLLGDPVSSVRNGSQKALIALAEHGQQYFPTLPAPDCTFNQMVYAAISSPARQWKESCRYWGIDTVMRDTVHFRPLLVLHCSVGSNIHN